MSAASCQGWLERWGALAALRAPRPRTKSAPRAPRRACAPASGSPGHPPDLFCPGLTRGQGWHQGYEKTRMAGNEVNLEIGEGGGSPQLYYHDCSGRIPGHTTRAPQVGFELETNCHRQLGQDFFFGYEKARMAGNEVNLEIGDADGCIKETESSSYCIWQYFTVSNSSDP